ncbi:MAG: S9 family peptidase [Thermoanaerobaculia bacterium]
MRITTALLGVTCLVFVFARSPEERTITDPLSVGSTANAGARPVAIDDLFFTRSIGDPTWSADGTEIAFTTNLTGRANLWKVSANGGWPLQLAVSDDRETTSTWSPDSKWIAWQEDKQGKEAYDIHLVPAGGGAPKNLTATDQISETDALFSPDTKMIAVAYKQVNAPATDVAVIDVATGTARNLTQEKAADRTWEPVAWSHDGKWLIANRRNADFTVGEIFRIDVATGQTTNLTPGSKVNVRASSLSHDDTKLLVTSNEKGGFDNVAMLDVATHKLAWITDLKWEAEARDFSPDGKWVTYTINEDGRSDAYLAPVSGGAAKKLAMPGGLNSLAGRPSAFSPRGDRLLLLHQSGTQTNDFWIYDIASDRATQLTRSAVASLDATPMPSSQIVHYKSFDGATISAFLWLPFNLERNGKNPGIVLPHGGPTGQTQDTFNRNVIALVSRGYTVIAPNVRGSTGYGMAFQKMNFKDLGGGDLEDEVYAAKFLAATGYIDAKKIGMAGGSYGGYMTLMALGKTPDVWAAGVDLFGIVDWYSMLQHEDPRLQEYEKSLLGDPVKDRAVYEAASPIGYLKNVKAPLLVLQGENDIRVPKEESEQVVSILKNAGKTVDVHYYPAEGHGFAKRENQIDAIRRMVDWFDRYLK